MGFPCACRSDSLTAMTGLHWRSLGSIGAAARGLALVGALLPTGLDAQTPSPGKAAASGEAAEANPPAAATPARIEVNGEALAQPRATFDPARGLVLAGQQAIASESAPRWVEIRLPFEFLEWPTPGTYPLAERTVMGPEHSGEPPRMVRIGGKPVGPPPASVQRTVRVEWVTGGAARPLDGRIELGAFGSERVSGVVHGALVGDERKIVFDLVPALRPLVDLPEAVGADASDGVLTSALEDLTLFAVGGTGTGLPDAAYVVESMASLASMEGLDSVLLLGDTLGVRGVTGRNDPAWQSRFNRLFDSTKFPVTCYSVLSQRERRGDQVAPLQYGFINPRWSMPQPTYVFDRHCKGQDIRFIGVDTQLLAGDIARPSTRVPLRVAVHAMEQSKADWLVVFGHDAMHGQGPTGGSKRAAKLRERLETHMRNFGVDAYISGGERSLQLIEPDGFGPDRKGPVHVISGAGGGREMADSFRVDGEAMSFGMTGGGFVRLRFDGKNLEIGFYDRGAQLRFARRLPPRQR